MDSAESKAAQYCWGHDPALVSKLRQQVVCRDSQLSLLLSLFGERSHLTPASVFMYGHTATGKTYITEMLLKTLDLPSVWVNCIECYSSRYLYEHVLNNLPLGQSKEKPAAPVTCDNMNDFVRHLKSEVDRLCLHNETLYIVLDRAERLRDMDVNILPAFLRLQELAGLNICTILLSEILWEKFRFGTGFCEPFTIYLPDFSQDELTKIMLLDCPDDCEAAYSNYISLFLSVFYYVCRDLKELRHMALLNFPKYMEPIQKGDVKESETRKLWRNIEPHLKRALRTVYLREVSSAQWEQMQTSQSDDQDGVTIPSVPVVRNHVELPYYSKYLLVAAYIASYNPAVSDKRFFCKKSGRVSKRSKLIKKQERASNHVLGPKPFPMDRLLAIFYTIVEEKIAPSAIIFSQISSLVNLHLLGQTCNDSQIEMPRYKCLVSLDFVRSVAKTIGFDVMKYLYDFI